MRDNGVRAFLVGETFMRSREPGEKLRECPVGRGGTGPAPGELQQVVAGHHVPAELFPAGHLAYLIDSKPVAADTRST